MAKTSRYWKQDIFYKKLKLLNKQRQKGKITFKEWDKKVHKEILKVKKL